MIELALIAVMMPIYVTRMAGFLAVLFGFVVLFPIFEQPIVAFGVVRANFFRIVTRSSSTALRVRGVGVLCELGKRFVAVKTGAAFNGPAIISVFPVVISHIIPPDLNPATGVPA